MHLIKEHSVAGGSGGDGGGGGGGGGGGSAQTTMVANYSLRFMREAKGESIHKWLSTRSVYEPQHCVCNSSQRHSGLVLSRERLPGMEKKGFATLDIRKTCAFPLLR